MSDKTATITLRARNSASAVINRAVESMERLKVVVDAVGSAPGYDRAAAGLDRIRHSAAGVVRQSKELKAGVGGIVKGVTGLTSSIQGVEVGLLGLAGGGGARGGRAGGAKGGIDGAISGISEGGEVIEEFAQGLESLIGPLWPLKAVFLGAGAGVAVLAGGMVLAAKSVGVFLEKTKEGEEATKRWSRSHDELVASIGGSIIGYKQAGGALDILASRMDRLAKWYRSSFAGVVFGFAKEIAGGIVTLTASAAGSVAGLLTTGVEAIRHFANIYLNTIGLMLASMRRLFNGVREMGRNFGLDFSGNNDMSRMDAALGGEVRAIEEGAKHLFERTSGWLVGIRDVTREARGDLAVLQNQIAGLELGTFGGLKKEGGKKEKHKSTAQAGFIEEIEGGNLPFGASTDGVSMMLGRVGRMTALARGQGWMKQFGDKFQKDGEKFAGFLERFHTPWIQLKNDIDAANKSMGALATQGMQGVITSVVDLVKAVAGGASMGKALQAWASQMGDLFTQVGLGYVFTGIGQIAITAGNPTSAIWAGSALAGVGLILGALSSGPQRRGGGGGGGVAGAVSDAFSSAVDRILAENRRKEQPIINNFVIEGERMDTPIRNSLGRLQAQGQLALQVIP